MGGFISFHVLPKGVHFKIAKQSFHVRSTFHSKSEVAATSLFYCCFVYCRFVMQITIKKARYIMDKEEYKELVKRRERRSPSPKNCLRAFWTGGLICVIGQLLTELFLTLGMNEKSASTSTTVALIFAAALLTGIGIFDRIARYAGAGTLVPVTGFANSVVSPAIDTKSEGLILGVGAKIFTVAGPVLLYATLSGAVYGVIYYIVSLFL